MIKSSRLTTAFMAIMFPFLDMLLTLCGQSKMYWAGNHDIINEINPIGHYFLRMGPNAFIWYFLGYVAAWYVAIAATPRFVATSLATLIIVSHSTGASSWLGDYSSTLTNVLMVFTCIAIVLVYQGD